MVVFVTEKKPTTNVRTNVRYGVHFWTEGNYKEGQTNCSNQSRWLKYHAIKAYTGSRGTAELILNFSTRLSGELHAPTALPRGRSLVFIEQKADEPQIQSGRFGGRK